MPRKKIAIVPADQAKQPEPNPKQARQRHTIVTTFSKDIPIEEAEPIAPEEEEIEFIAEEEEAPEAVFPVPVENSYSDSISNMLADLNVSKRSHSWTMVIERLPNYQKDGRHDVQSKRVNCGTRPMSLDFLEDIRREFARPGKPNDFRITIKRDGKIYAHWPEVICLEPPAADQIAEFEQSNPAPAPAFPAPANAPSFTTVLNQMKQLAELRTVLFPEMAKPAEPIATEEAALLKLLASNGNVIERITDQLSERLFKPPQDEATASWMPLLKSAFDNGPSIVRELFAGLTRMREPAPAPAPPELTPGPAPQNEPPPPPPPELILLSNVIRMCELNTPAPAAAQFVDAFIAQFPTVTPMVEAFLTMAPDECIDFLKGNFPKAAPILELPRAPQWISDLQKNLTEEAAGAGDK